MPVPRRAPNAPEVSDEYFDASYTRARRQDLVYVPGERTGVAIWLDKLCRFDVPEKTKFGKLLVPRAAGHESGTAKPTAQHPPKL